MHVVLGACQEGMTQANVMLLYLGWWQESTRWHSPLGKHATCDRWEQPPPTVQPLACKKPYFGTFHHQLPQAQPSYSSCSHHGASSLWEAQDKSNLNSMENSIKNLMLIRYSSPAQLRSPLPRLLHNAKNHLHQGWTTGNPSRTISEQKGTLAWAHQSMDYTLVHGRVS